MEKEWSHVEIAFVSRLGIATMSLNISRYELQTALVVSKGSRINILLAVCKVCIITSWA